MTSFPTLLAKQLGSSDFQSPLFNESEANGTGFFIYSNQSKGYPKWKHIQNNLASVIAGDPPVISPYFGAVRNFGVPFMSGYRMNDTWQPAGDYVNGTDNKWLNYHPYLWRLLASSANEKIGAIDFLIKKQPYNFFMLEDKIDDWFATIRRNDDLQSLSFYQDLAGGFATIPQYLKKLTANGSKGVIFTIPDFQDLACMDWYPTSDLQAKATPLTITYTRYGRTLQLDTKKPFCLMATQRIDSLFNVVKKGDAVSVTLTDVDVMDEKEIQAANPDAYNYFIRQWAKQYNVAIVDLHAIYRQIHQGKYITDDG